MFHLMAYQGNAFGVNNYSLTPIPDSMMAISNGHFFPSSPMNLYGGYFAGTLLTAAMLYTPKTRAVVPPRLNPINAVVPAGDRPHIFDRRNNPFVLNAAEEIDFQVNLGGAANAVVYALLFAGPSLDPVPAGDIYALHGTSTTTTTAFTWSQLAMTWDQVLPAGEYTIIGSQHQSTNGLAHRWIFRTNNQLWRPGFISQSSLTNMTDPSIYYGGWGSFGTFNTYSYPNIEVLCNGADAAHDVTMFMVKTR